MLSKSKKILTPPVEFIRRLEKKKSDGCFYSFFYNISKKKENSDEWKIAERYVINVMNLVPQERTEYYISNIIGCEPKIMKSKNGKDYLNCCVWCDLDVIENNHNNNANNTYQTPQYNAPQNQNNTAPTNDNFNVEDDDLPF